jgi:quercetin dioxygenase-like cupin family protein
MKRFRMLVVALAGLAACAVAATVVLAADGGPSGVQVTPISQGTIGSKVHANSGGIKIRTLGPRLMLVTAITVDPGGTFGWHSHPGPVLVTVNKGTFTLYRAHGSSCAKSTFGPGDAFVEPGGDVHLGRNEGSEPVALNAIFLAPTGTNNFLLPQQEPKACNV